MTGSLHLITNQLTLITMLQEKITTILPEPLQNTDGTYSIYFTTQNIITKKITTHQRHYRQYDDAVFALKHLKPNQII